MVSLSEVDKSALPTLPTEGTHGLRVRLVGALGALGYIRRALAGCLVFSDRFTRL